MTIRMGSVQGIVGTLLSGVQGITVQKNTEVASTVVTSTLEEEIEVPVLCPNSEVVAGGSPPVVVESLCRVATDSVDCSDEASSVELLRADTVDCCSTLTAIWGLSVGEDVLSSVVTIRLAVEWNATTEVSPTVAPFAAVVGCPLTVDFASKAEVVM